MLAPARTASSRASAAGRPRLLAVAGNVDSEHQLEIDRRWRGRGHLGAPAAAEAIRTR